MYHDLSDDYRMREYVAEITLQEAEYSGAIYFKYSSSGYGLTRDTMNLIYGELGSNNSGGIWGMVGGVPMKNSIDLLFDYSRQTISFSLKDKAGNILNKIIPEDQLERYITGINMISCEGCGKKKERRKCISCKKFSPLTGTAKGYCSAKQEKVPGSRIICAFEYAPRD